MTLWIDLTFLIGNIGLISTLIPTLADPDAQIPRVTSGSVVIILWSMGAAGVAAGLWLGAAGWWASAVIWAGIYLWRPTLPGGPKDLAVRADLERILPPGATLAWYCPGCQQDVAPRDVHEGAWHDCPDGVGVVVLAVRAPDGGNGRA